MVAVDICNLALSYLGDTATVASIDPPEGSAQAQHCARFYPIALGVMLEMHQWNFTTLRDSLAVVASPFSYAWAYAYAMPSAVTDIISVLPLIVYEDCFGLPYGAWNYGWRWRETCQWELEALRDFQVETVNGQQVILSNATDAIIRYTTSQVQPGNFPVQFANALARLLASMLAGPLLKGDAGAAESARQYKAYEIAAGPTMSQDANQKQGNQYHMPASIRARC